MDDKIDEIKQNEGESLSTKTSKLQAIMLKIRKISPKTAIIIAVVVIAGVFAYAYRGSLIVATVNGSPISRFAVIGKLEKNFGKQTLDSLITDKLVSGELDKKKITVTNDEINAYIKNVEDKIKEQGSTLIQALAAQGMTMADLRGQISVNLRIEKLFADKIQVSDNEISQYIKDNKLTVPNGQAAQYNQQIKDQLKSNKLSKIAKDWVNSIRSQASIHYFVNY